MSFEFLEKEHETIGNSWAKPMGVAGTISHTFDLYTSINIIGILYQNQGAPMVLTDL